MSYNGKALMIVSTRMNVRMADLFFDEPRPRQMVVDLVRFHQAPVPIAGASCTPFPTIVIDLSCSQEELLSKMKNHTRYKIRRASEKDGFAYEFSDGKDAETITRFADHVDRCAALKCLPRVSRRWLGVLAGKRVLDLSFVLDNAGKILAASSYILTPVRVRGLYAGALYRETSDHARRTLIGRANRFLYWRDMLRFKQSGVRTFDFGGYYTGTEDEEKLRVNEFKSEFGGKILLEFNCTRGLTLKGKFALWMIQQRGKWPWQYRSRIKQSTAASVSASV